MEHPGPVVPVTYGMVKLHGQGNVVVAPLPVNPAQGIHGDQTVEGLRETQVQRHCIQGTTEAGNTFFGKSGFPKSPFLSP